MSYLCAVKKYKTMTTKNIKKLPYGNSDFESIILENYAYVDKTRFIELLENEANKYQFFIRPRKFGKSLFLSVLANYYDIRKASQFEQLFGDLYIGKNPTRRKNSYAVMSFNFSGLNTRSEEGFVKSFANRVQNTITKFISLYRDFIPNADTAIQEIKTEKSGVDSFNILFEIIEPIKLKIFVVIDEYDHFANDLIAMGSHKGKDFYSQMVEANGLVRDFYEILKIGATNVAVIDRIFITGISPVMLDNLTSGFNIADNLTIKLRYNEMMGFTQTEVDALMCETGVDPARIDINMTSYYNGYLFNGDGENRLYNSTMVLYFFSLILNNEKTTAENIIDSNLKTDYGRLRQLVRNEKNKETLIEIIKEGSIVSDIVREFPMEIMYDDEYFISLLFYMGLLTIKEDYFGKYRLQIPNYSIRTVFWEYLGRLSRESSPEMTIDTRRLNEAIRNMAIHGDVHTFIECVSQNAFSNLSDIDLRRFDEKYIKVMLLSYLFQSNVYVVMSEFETGDGYSDIFLQRNPKLPEVKYEWLLELKYLKAGDEKNIPKAKQEASEQLQRYMQAYRLTGRADLKTAIILFIGKNKFEIFE